MTAKAADGGAGGGGGGKSGKKSSKKHKSSSSAAAAAASAGGGGSAAGADDGGGGGSTARTASSSRQSLPNPPSLIDGPTQRFLVFEAPNDANLALYIDELERHRCRHLVRACDPTYSEEPLLQRGVAVHEFTFADGTAPPDSVVNDWLKLLRSIMAKEAAHAASSGAAASTTTTTTAAAADDDTPSAPGSRRGTKTSASGKNGSSKNGGGGGGGAAGAGGGDAGKPVIAVHCVAGLGRAPILVAIALIEAGLDPLDVIKEIRSKRPGALNMPQLKYLKGYKRKSKPCSVM